MAKNCGKTSLVKVMLQHILYLDLVAFNAVETGDPATATPWPPTIPCNTHAPLCPWKWGTPGQLHWQLWGPQRCVCGVIPPPWTGSWCGQQLPIVLEPAAYLTCW